MAILLGINDAIELPALVGSISFWMRTTQVPGGIPAEVCSQHQSSASGPGWGFTMDSNGYTSVYGKSSPSSIVLSLSGGTVKVNDGAWHHIALKYWFSTGIEQQLWIDGVKKDGVAMGGNFNTNIYCRLGRSNDGFWLGYVGEFAEVGVWGGPSLSGYLPDDAVKALAQGYRPNEVYLRDMKTYCPLVGSVRDLVGTSGQPTLYGGSVSDHGLRMF